MPNLSDYAPQARGAMLSFEDLLQLAMSAPQYVKPALNPDAGFVDLGQYAPDPIGSFMGGATKGLMKPKKPSHFDWRGASGTSGANERAGERGDYGGFGGGGAGGVGGYYGGMEGMGLGDISSGAWSW